MRKTNEIMLKEINDDNYYYPKVYVRYTFQKENKEGIGTGSVFFLRDKQCEYKTHQDMLDLMEAIKKFNNYPNNTVVIIDYIRLLDN